MKTFKKQLLRMGTWVHPKNSTQIKIDKPFLETLVDNFKKSPFAPILRGHNEKEAEKNPALIINKNISGLEIQDDGLYGVLDVDPKEVEKYNDVSLGIDPNGKDNKTGKGIGAVIRHVAFTMNPYIKGLKPFVALEDESYFITLSEIMDEKENKVDSGEVTMEEVKDEVEEEVKEEVKEEKEVDEKEEEAVKEEVESEDKVESEEEPKGESEEETELSETETLQSKIVELEDKLSKQAQTTALREAEIQFNELLQAGKIVPAQKDSFLALCSVPDMTIELSDGEIGLKEALNTFVESMPVAVEFGEEGVEQEEKPNPLKTELRERHPDLTDEEYDKWYEKNEKTIKDAI